MRFTIIGSGAASRRYLRVIRASYPQARVAHLRRRGSSQGSQFPADEQFDSWEQAMEWRPDFAIISNAATGHIAHLEECINHSIPTLVEKPLGASAADLDHVKRLLRTPLPPILVGYALQHHSLVRKMHSILASGAIGSVVLFRAAVGQHLRLWRPHTPHTESASARAALGGGVILELSHEVDMAIRVAGGPVRVDAQTCTSGIATTEVEDIANILMTHESGGLSSLSLNMIEEPAYRSWTAVGEGGSVELDLIRGALTSCTSAGKTVITELNQQSADTIYQSEIAELVTLGREGGSPSVTIEDGIRSLAVCLAAVSAAKSRQQSQP